MGSQQYNSRDLQKITPELGDGYIIEYRDILIKILGDILPKPENIKYDENNNIYEIYFKDPEITGNQPPEDSINDVSNQLKEKLQTSIDTFSQQKNESAKQALLILKSFDQKWLDTENLIFSDGNVSLRCWGVLNRRIVKKLTEEDEPSDSTSDNFWPLDLNKVGFLIVLGFIALFLIIKTCFVDVTLNENLIHIVKYGESLGSIANQYEIGSTFKTQL